jgi:outer membrane protein TolC
MRKFQLRYLITIILFHQNIYAQRILTLKDALETAINNYPSIKAKDNYIKASMALGQEAKREALPNAIVSGQQDYGTVNGQNGPLYSYGYAVASSGIPLNRQNWDAAFGSLYLANVNWDFFAFGRARERVKAAQSYISRDSYDREQELFEQEVRLASSYLNLLAAQRLTRSALSNLERADTLKAVVTRRAKSGLVAGVDSSQANAELSNAKTILTNAKDAEQERSSQLATLMGEPEGDFILDTLFIATMPSAFTDTGTDIHPLLKFYNSRISVSEAQAKYINTLKYPTFSLFGVFQARGSGFSADYISNPAGYDKGYLNGTSPDRINYLVGVGLTWNITSLARVKQQLSAQHYVSRALQEEYNLVSLQLKSQQLLADKKIANAISNFYEAPVQVRAASDAFLQKTVLYKNGLTDIVEVTQTLYALNRAETNLDIAYNNVWQSLLLKAASTGDFDLFIKAIK